MSDRSAGAPREQAIFRILFVCTANVCRSPYAQATLTEALRGNPALRDAVVAESAGTRAQPHQPLCTLGGSLLAAHPSGRALTEVYRTHRLGHSVIERSGLILTSELAHRSIASAMSPRSQSRIFTLLEAVILAELVAGAPVVPRPDPPSIDDRFARWVESLDHARGLRSVAEAVEIADGHAMALRRHRETLRNVDAAVARLVIAMTAVV